jgi:hypothetical protein
MRLIQLLVLAHLLEEGGREDRSGKGNDLSEQLTARAVGICASFGHVLCPTREGEMSKIRSSRLKGGNDRKGNPMPLRSNEESHNSECLFWGRER